MDINDHKAVWEQIVGPRPGLYLPERAAPADRRPVGTRFVIVVGRNNLPEPAKPGEFWDRLNELPMPGGLIALAKLNLVCARIDFQSAEHKSLRERLLTADRLAQVDDFIRSKAGNTEPTHLFNRVALLLLERLALGVASPAPQKELSPRSLLGELALLANDYVTGSVLRRAPESVEPVTMMIEALPSWEITNEPDLAYGLTRAYRLLQVNLLGADPNVVALREQIGLDFSTVTFDGLTLDEYVACVFGLYSSLSSHDLTGLPAGKVTAVINPATVLGETKFPKQLLEAFLSARSRTPEQFRSEFANLSIKDSAALEASVASDTFIADALPLRQYPICKIADDAYVCLDTTFLSELLITGVYWQVLNQLQKAQGDIFVSLWGRLLELHLAEMMRFFYRSSPLSPLLIDVPYREGQIDLLLDFGPDVILFEIKGSLLKSAAKYNRDRRQFEREFALKFVENEKGDPKALRQLARASVAALNGELPLAKKPQRIFPVLVGYEPCLDSFWVNRYADELFQGYVDADIRNVVRPLTVMSVEAFEEVVPYAACGDISLTDLLELRFFEVNGQTKVVDSSMSQAIYDWRKAAAKDVRRNEFMLTTFEEVFKKAMAKYRGDGT